MSDYNFSAKFLHDVALDNYSISKLSFILGKNLVAKKYNIDNIKKVFVSGLARCGTKVLTAYLSKKREFVSLTYQDMPFPLMPNLWRKINTSRNALISKERSHGDGLMINYQSVEEIEEYFWKVFSNDTFISDKTLDKYSIDSSTLENFNNYINSILNCSDQNDNLIYLSKNNNQILRLESLYNGLPNSYFIILTTSISIYSSVSSYH